jgi:hypothetical protein
MKELESIKEIIPVEQPQLRAEYESGKPTSVFYKVVCNVYSKKLSALSDWRRMCIVIDGELFPSKLVGFNLGKEEYLIAPNTGLLRNKPRNIKAYLY